MQGGTHVYISPPTKAKTVRAGPLLLNCSVTAPGKEHAPPSDVFLASGRAFCGSAARKMDALKAVKPLQVSSVTDSPAPSANINLCVRENVGG
jgi:hypothetical protein